MNNMIFIEIKDEKALYELRKLEGLNLIKFHSGSASENRKLSEKYRGILTKEQGKQLNSHINEMRNEWNVT